MILVLSILKCISFSNLPFFYLAEDCSPEVDYFIVPIAVGAALGGLVVLVIMAYFLGHKKHHNTGYEQF